MPKIEMKIETTVQGDMTIVSVSGVATPAARVAPLHDHIKKLLQDGARNMLIDATRIHHVCRSFLEVIVAALETVSNEGGSLSLALPDNLARLFDHTPLSSLPWRSVWSVPR